MPGVVRVQVHNKVLSLFVCLFVLIPESPEPNLGPGGSFERLLILTPPPPPKHTLNLTGMLPGT